MWVQGVSVLACLTLVYLAPSRCLAGPSIVHHSEDDNSAPTMELVQKEGYPCEAHNVVTQDGYVLTVHRIPGGRDRPMNRDLHPVYLMHGLMGSSADWVLKGPNEALAFLLADKGYDVWMGNARGNIYSRLHKTLPANDVRYWNFSWHEIGHTDLPVCIDYVLKVTGHPKVHYIGYSMGTTVLFVFLSTRPQYNAKICSVTALAPVVFMKYVTTPLRVFAPGTNIVEKLAEKFGAELMPRTPGGDEMARHLCTLTDVRKSWCENMLYFVCGLSLKETDKDLLPKIIGHTPAGTSIKTTSHYAQIMNSDDRFQWYDNGPHDNLKAYNSINPLEYKLASVTAPVNMIHSNVDKLSTPMDVIKLYKVLPNSAGLHIVNQTFNHLDFIYGKDAKTLVYDLVIKLLEDRGRCSSGKPTKRYRSGA